MSRTIRTLSLPELRILLSWAADEGWNPGINDAVAFAAADPNGFLGAFVDGTMVAGISAVAYDASFGFVGLYICHPAWRGQGHGKAVWDAGMAHLGDRTIGLDGVPQQQANYAGMGFVAAYDTVRMSGILPATVVRDPGGDVVAVGDIRALDRAYFPAPRDSFLKHWLASPNTATLHRRAGTVGYAVRRVCLDGAKLGPVFADGLSTAIDLLSRQSGSVHLDVPAMQTEWLDVLAKAGFTSGFRTTRMYRGTAPSIPISGVFAITSLELG